MQATIWGEVVKVLESPFTTSLIGTLAGAFAGAWAAQRIAERVKSTELLLSQLRTTNAAIIATQSICNTYISVKKQQVLPFYEEYSLARSQFVAIKNSIKNGEIPKGQTIETTTPMRSFQIPLIPIATLQQLIIDKLPSYGKIAPLVLTLASVASSIENLLRKNNEITESIAKQAAINHEKLVYYYFGEFASDGGINTEFKDITEGIHNQTNDMIFFSYLLCKDLMELGEKIMKSIKARKIKTDEIIHMVDFKAVIEDGTIPNEADYNDWLKGFKVDESYKEDKKKWYLRILKIKSLAHSIN